MTGDELKNIQCRAAITEIMANVNLYGASITNEEYEFLKECREAIEKDEITENQVEKLLMIWHRIC